MATQNLTQNPTPGNTNLINQQHSRREFLAGLSALSLLPLAGNVTLQSTLIDSLSDPDFFPGLAPAYPDLERAALIDEWAGRVELAMDTLTKFWETLMKARILAPAEVDPVSLHALSIEVCEAMDTLHQELDTDEFGQFFEIVTGKQEWTIYLERAVNEGVWSDSGAQVLRDELIYLGQENENLDEIPRLLALFDAKQVHMAVK